MNPTNFSLQSQAHFVLLHVQSPAASASFYRQILAAEPVEASPTFAMFALAPGLMLGLWACDTVVPASAGQGGSSELAFVQDSAAAVDAVHAAWVARGVLILQAPSAMDFGYTFTASDPDGHRLRVFAPGAA